MTRIMLIKNGRPEEKVLLQKAVDSAGTEKFCKQLLTFGA
jgi:hypothetical protein